MSHSTLVRENQVNNTSDNSDISGSIMRSWILGTGNWIELLEIGVNSKNLYIFKCIMQKIADRFKTSFWGVCKQVTMKKSHKSDPEKIVSA